MIVALRVRMCIGAEALERETREASVFPLKDLRAVHIAFVQYLHTHIVPDHDMQFEFALYRTRMN